MTLGPFQRALTPGVVITHDQNCDKDKHFNQRKRCEREVLSHENDRPWQKENCFHVKNKKEHRHDVVAHSEPFVRLRGRIDAAFIGTHLPLLVLNGS